MSRTYGGGIDEWGDFLLMFTPAYMRFVLGILFLTNVLNYMDRMILSVVLEDIKLEFHLSDTQIGLLSGFAFAIFYGTAGILIARLADRYDRKVIICVSMVIWSGITAATGAAQNFFQLFLARIGVGVGEAGVIPAATAMIADYFEPARRSAALAIFSAGTTIGMTCGLAFGGIMAAQFGWRWAFLAAGVPGVPLAFLIWKTLREPKRGMSDGLIGTSQPKMIFQTVCILLKNKSYVHNLLGACFVFFVMFGVVQWLPALLIRKFNLDTAQVGIYFGSAFGLGGALGTVIGGFVTNRLARRDMSWLIRVPFIVTFIFFPVYEVALFVPNPNLTLVLVFFVNVVGGSSFGPIAAVMQSVVEPSMRATAAAIYGFCVSIIAIGGAPFLIGATSDYLSRSMDAAEALQLAMAIALVFSLLALVHFRLTMRTFLTDLKRIVAN